MWNGSWLGGLAAGLLGGRRPTESWGGPCSRLPLPLAGTPAPVACSGWAVSTHARWGLRSEVGPPFGLAWALPSCTLTGCPGRPVSTPHPPSPGCKATCNLARAASRLIAALFQSTPLLPPLPCPPTLSQGLRLPGPPSLRSHSLYPRPGPWLCTFECTVSLPSQGPCTLSVRPNRPRATSHQPGARSSPPGDSLSRGSWGRAAQGRTGTMRPASAPLSLPPVGTQIADPGALGFGTPGWRLVQTPASPSPPWAPASPERPLHSSWSDVASLAGSRGSRLALQSSFIGTWS